MSGKGGYVAEITRPQKAWPRNGRWDGLPLAARLYLGATFVTAVVCLAVTWTWAAPVRSVESFAATACILGCAAALAVFMGQPSRGHRSWGRRSSHTIEAGSVFLFAAVLMLPPRWAVVPMAVWGITGWICHQREWYKALFDFAFYAVGMLAVAAIGHVVLNPLLEPDAQPGPFTLVIASGAVTWALINAVAMAGILYMTTRAVEHRVFWPNPGMETGRVALGGVLVALYSVSWWWALLAASAGYVVLAEVAGQSHRVRSLTDSKTGLANAAELRETLAREVARARRGAGAVSVAVLDLDHFRRVNDAYRHQGGDQALVQLGTLLRDTAREQDLVSRWGGDELVWLMPGEVLVGALGAAERFRALVASHAFELNGVAATLSVSIGVATWEDSMSGDELLRRADEEVFAAKAAGRNRVEPAKARSTVQPEPEPPAGSVQRLHRRLRR